MPTKPRKCSNRTRSSGPSIAFPEGDASTWKPLASLWCGLAVLPLIGCAGNVTAIHQEPASPPTAIAETAPVGYADPGTYATGSASPAAVLVLLPPMGMATGEDFLVGNPALWTAQGFDVVMPQPSEIYQLVTDQRRALGRLVASARALADAPIWLVGPSPAIETALAAEPQIGGGQISGVVVTSVTSNGISCSESVSYYDPGTGAAPKVTVKKSGSGCGAIQPSASGRQPSPVPMTPGPRPKPRIIEASAAAKPLSPAAQEPLARNLAELIKASPFG